MVSRVLNFLWLNLDLPARPDPEDGSIRQPLPPKYIENVRQAARAHPTTKVVLWVDSKRLTEKQWDYLQNAIEDRRSNAELKDLRAIPAYDKEPLYNQAETDPNWRNGGQDSLIWRQVDAAKILVSLQGKFDHVFFADLDHSHLEVTSPKVKTMLKKHGLLIGSYSADYVAIENQVWGFGRSRKGFFKEYYETALKVAHEGDNAWDALRDKVSNDLGGVPTEEICLLIGDDGSSAEHPGHEWRGGDGDAAPPDVIASGELSKVFNRRSRSPRKDRKNSPFKANKPGVKAKAAAFAGAKAMKA